MGVWTSAEEAEKHIKEFSPAARRFVGIPDDIARLPKGEYYIESRTLFTSDRSRAAALIEQLGKK